ncbi:MAG: S46 family peptidase [Candidatus Aminicenantes bacterium]|nr:MAG: S46 family peptidase [Candidatus Aminicenantes bacterium]
MKLLKLLLSIPFILFLVLSSPADEGMWMPHQMTDLNLRSLGLQMNPEDLYKKDGTGLMSAVVHLGGGSGEFVSKEGLILTNHHVAFGALQRASTPEKDYIQNGFIAWTKKEEIPSKGSHADVLLGYEEITERVVSVLKPSMSYRQKYDALEKVRKKIIAEAEKQGADIRARVASMYSGNQYYLFLFKRLKDIRIVYAPPRDLGNYGGDIDNWMWPRHTCDFAFFRAYVSKDNIGADYSPDNIPYQPKSILKISLEGFQEDDFSFVMGFPGRTYRNYTFSELENDIENMKKRITLYSDIIAFLEKASENNREIQIKYARIVRGLNNSLKNYQGKIEGMENIAILDKKTDQEKEFLDWESQNPDSQKMYAKVLDDIKIFMKRYRIHSDKSNLLSQLVSSYLGSALLSQAYTIYRAVQERQKPDIEREPGFQERDMDDIKQNIELAERGFDLKTDRAFLTYRLKSLVDYPYEQVPKAFKNLLVKPSNEAIERYVDNLYDNTSLADKVVRLKLLEMTPKELLKLDDPLLNLAADLEKEKKELREKGKSLNQERLDLKKIYLDGLLAQKEGRIAPDANSTIRFTYGFIRGYAPRDAVFYLPQTTLKGVIEKETGKFPFHVPPKLKTLHKKSDFGQYVDEKLNDIPACFLNTTNVTGGNSGSPALNAKGEQIGIIFDMTYESVTGDYYVIPELQRTISVDIRYVLFVTDKFSGATHLIAEMGL